MNESCKTCRFRDISRGVWGKVDCRRYPPTYRESGEWLFPTLNSDAVCGEWQGGEPLVGHRDLHAQVADAEKPEHPEVAAKRHELALLVWGNPDVSWHSIISKIRFLIEKSRKS